MAILKAYFDDSGDEKDPQHKVCSIGGFVATAKNWQNLETKWQRILNSPEFDVPYFHMKEFAHFKGPFKKWENNEEKRRAFLQSLIKIMRECRILGTASILLLDDFRRFIMDNGLFIDEYSFNLYNCIALMIDKIITNSYVEIVVDRSNNVSNRIDIAQKYLDTDINYPNYSYYITIKPLPKGITFREVIPIQTADFIAWEIRDDVDTKYSLFADPNLGDNLGIWFKSLFEWCKKENRNPFPRGSFNHLLNNIPTWGKVWDYNYLCKLHQKRRGFWPV